MDKEKDWKGYTLDELRFRRVLNMTKTEMEKNAVMQRLRHSWGGASSAEGRGLMHKMIGALDYLDYAVIAFTVGKKLFKLFRRGRG